MFQSVNVATISLKSLHRLTGTSLCPIQVKAVIFKLSYSLLAAPFKIVHDLNTLTIGCTVLCASYGITKL